jgi:hypothetical protein
MTEVHFGFTQSLQKNYGVVLCKSNLGVQGLNLLFIDYWEMSNVSGDISVVILRVSIKGVSKVPLPKSQI